MNYQSPGYNLPYAWFEYVREGGSRKRLQASIVEILVSSGIDLADAAESVSVLDALPYYFPWDDYFPDVPSSYCW